jgi:hypothetical protein
MIGAVTTANVPAAIAKAWLAGLVVGASIGMIAGGVL